MNVQLQCGGSLAAREEGWLYPCMDSSIDYVLVLVDWKEGVQ